MALYIADLSTTTGWTERWATSEGSFAANSTPTRLTITKSSETNEYGISLDAVDADENRDDIEILAKIRFNTQAAASRMCGVFARGSGTTDSENGLICLLYDGGNDGTDFRPYLTEMVAGTIDFIAGDTASNVAATWYWMRFRVNGTSVKAKCWADGAIEPSAWDIDTTNTAVTGVGWVGFYGKDTATDTYDLGYFAIATNGDTIGGGSAKVQFIGI